MIFSQAPIRSSRSKSSHRDPSSRAGPAPEPSSRPGRTVTTGGGSSPPPRTEDAPYRTSVRVYQNASAATAPRHSIGARSVRPTPCGGSTCEAQSMRKITRPACSHHWTASLTVPLLRRGALRGHRRRLVRCGSRAAGPAVLRGVRTAAPVTPRLTGAHLPGHDPDVRRVRHPRGATAGRCHDHRRCPRADRAASARGRARGRCAGAGQSDARPLAAGPRLARRAQHHGSSHRRRCRHEAVREDAHNARAASARRLPGTGKRRAGTALHARRQPKVDRRLDRQPTVDEWWILHGRPNPSASTT